ncbi:hypothetical protein HYE60_12030 [Aggregatibacter actinomycetemcomitans]|uniref:factor H-binding protein n=1 Tax=Aggregatibacter actinomycetemcomitans TaxID=714 RepID=UPI00197BDF6F|nr:factor H-binding protein [Aggregatibacter actinomycetemcomitans]MBN6075952.1 hypothetical protein [Aggregatibacter actinomycetemcomitans]
MKTKYLLAALTVACTLSACSQAAGGLADGLLKPFDPKAKDWKQLTISESVPDNGTLELTDRGGKTRILRKGGVLDTGYLRSDRVSDYDYVKKINVNGQIIELERGDFLIYKQNNSIVAATLAKQKTNADGTRSSTFDFHVNEIQGRDIAFNNLPASGQVNYRGIAFTGDDRGGHLSYTIDFAKKQGSGRISGLRGDYNVDLAQTDVRAMGNGSGLSGKAVKNGVEKGNYTLKIFGSKAEEIAGKAEIKTGKGTQEIGLAGKKE